MKTLFPDAGRQFKENFCRFREWLKHSQSKLSEKGGFHSRSVQRWEAGDNYPSVEALLLIASSHNYHLIIGFGTDSNNPNQIFYLLNLKP